MVGPLVRRWTALFATRFPPPASVSVSATPLPEAVRQRVLTHSTHGVPRIRRASRGMPYVYDAGKPHTRESATASGLGPAPAFNHCMSRRASRRSD